MILSTNCCSQSQWWSAHIEKCKPQTTKPAPTIKLAPCFVLIENLVIPNEEGLDVNGTNVLEQLNLDDANSDQEGDYLDEEEEELVDRRDFLIAQHLSSNLNAKIL